MYDYADDQDDELMRPKRLEPERESFREFAKRQNRRFVRVNGQDMRGEATDPFILFANGARSDGQFHHAEPPKKGCEEWHVLLHRYHTIRAEELVRKFRRTKEQLMQRFSTGQSVDGYKEKLEQITRLTKWHDEQAAMHHYNAPSQVRQRQLDEAQREGEEARRLALNQALAVRF